MIGDVLASTVICQAIKTSWPDCIVHYMIHKNTAPVVEGNPFIDKIIRFDQSETKGIAALIAYGKSLKKENYHAVVDAYGKWESIIASVFSGTRIRIGHFKWYTAPFFSKTVVPKKEVSGSAIYHRLQLAEALTGEFTSIAFPKIYLSESEYSDAGRKLADEIPNGTPAIMISVLGSGDSKSLPPRQMAETLDIIAKSEVILLFNFMPSQKDMAREIYDMCQPETRTKILFDLYTKSLREFLAVLSHCDALVGNEGGAVNMAKALDVPTFTIFSPWVNKSSWDMLSGEDHFAVHLNDYHPEIYNGKHAKTFRNQVPQLYQKLKPELFRSKLEAFITKITS